ncbi:MAG: UDP-N-acetylglucosamine 1-carboxyvinyltransferase [Proteobacteria bacterium]|jgi:UDP-N-acetylglucosamine 1-carboxyvinyltransferase|nr:UDP-N-acetylglucosamine 1-carboxyvinyltransferase [Desulfocapsa sp.]MBU3945627.1 UDP-N-acetylglucosamine 1-carboxyvinyltransferase [Pseudomonadota bacterium]MCG2745872.1 UDP-N-acetylglucosamine 1-carboxyvinyltransferase [Desulfobacteraceae bacterium]MBU4029669.1 UDP-N-acetylglucosamine 1-carboxyvinyltransferase [Pseudomonadota bacterium]MBU4043466.1 UDP-N-acetylglucosamine 1-carboxyvinyltransferase [Pseudomonadota bacterium]
MEKLIIEGGRPLYGQVRISGAKNAALPLIAATLLAEGIHTLNNVPDLRDTRTILRLLESLGITWERQGATLRIDSTNLTYSEASYDLVKTMRASVLVLGPLLARLGKAKVSLPGGCAIGARPIDFHIKGFEQLGVTCRLEQGYVDAEIDGRMQGNNIYFDVPSVTGTENLVMAAALAQGTTIIKNAAKEPEIGNLVDMLTAMGAEIEGRCTDRLTIHGVKKLYAAESEIIPDRIEAGTYLIAVAATGGEVTVTDCNPAHLPSLLDKLRAAGMEIKELENTITLDATGRRKIKNVDIKTMPYPGYPTDLQAQFMALMALSEGVSMVHETIFENRFMHVAELHRMGADITIDGHVAVVKGVGRSGFYGAPVMATDLRASSSLVIAGLAAEGRTEISRIYHLERGYEQMVEKLTALGATVWKEQE